MWAILKSYPAGRMLDIPSGPGYFALRAQEAEFDVLAAEIDESAHVFPQVKYVKVDASTALPFETDHFDYIVSIEGIEHLENQFLFLRECARVLKKGGRLFLTTPNASSLENRFYFFLTGFHENPPRPSRSDLPNVFMEHINLIPFHRLETYLRFAGLQVETLTTNKMRKGSNVLYPLVCPFMALLYRATWRKYFKTERNRELYRDIFRKHRSRAVACSGNIVVVARKR